MKEHSAHSRTFSVWQWLAAGSMLALSFSLAADELPLSETNLKNLGPDAYFEAGEQVTGRVCTSCHGWESVLAARMTPSQWNFTVSDMVAKGAKATPDEKEFIARFMSWAWGKVSVNSAPAEDLALVIGLPMVQAEAVVAYRQEHGTIENLEELKQVPCIDVTALERQGDALQFD